MRIEITVAAEIVGSIGDLRDLWCPRKHRAALSEASPLRISSLEKNLMEQSEKAAVRKARILSHSICAVPPLVAAILFLVVSGTGASAFAEVSAFIKDVILTASDTVFVNKIWENITSSIGYVMIALSYILKFAINIGGFVLGFIFIYCLKSLIVQTSVLPSNKTFNILCAVSGGISFQIISMTFYNLDVARWYSANLDPMSLTQQFLILAMFIFILLFLFFMKPLYKNKDETFPYLVPVICVCWILFATGFLSFSRYRNDGDQIRDALLATDVNAPHFQAAESFLYGFALSESQPSVNLPLISAYTNGNIDQISDNKLKINLPADSGYLDCTRTSDTTVRVGIHILPQLTLHTPLREALAARACMIAFNSAPQGQ